MRAGAERGAAFPMPDGELLDFLAKRGIRRAQEPEEWRGFAAFAQERLAWARGISIVEIGTQSGGTFFTFYNLFHDSLAVLASVDLRLYARIDMAYPRGHCADEYRAFDRLVGELGDARIRVIVGDSHLPSTRDALSRALGGRRIDLCFIDGDHGYEGVRADCLMYGGMARPGGLICFHDIVTPETSAGPLPVGVRRCWEEIRAGRRWTEFTAGAEKGIGVIEA